MKRWPLVFGGTVAGLVGVLTFHTTPASSGLAILGASAPPGGAPGGSPAASASAASAAGAAGAGKPASAHKPATTGKPAAGKPAAAASPASVSATRTATGPQVNYNWGILSVRVTVTGKKIVNIGIASLDDGGNPRSQMIDQESIPLLEQQVMQAQSANIQGVSGASYTSAGFVQSLQSALQSLGV